MQTTMISRENGRAVFQMQFSESELRQATEKVYRDTREHFSVDGFRKGKAPRAMIEKRYGDNTFTEPAVHMLAENAFADAARQLSLEPAAQPEMEIAELAAGALVTARVTLFPTLPVKDYTGISVKRVKAPVTEIELRRELDRVRKMYAQKTGVAEKDIVMDDAFAKQVSGAATMQELTQQLREAMERRASIYSIAQTKDAIVAKVLEINPYTPDNAIVVNEVNKRVDAMRVQLSRQGMTMEQYMEKTGQTMEIIVKGFIPEVTANLRTQVLMTSIAEAENIAVTQEDVENEIDAMSRQFHLEREQLRNSLGEERLQALPRDIRIKKAIDFLYDCAVIED